MQYSKLAVIAALAAPLAVAQNLADLPTCAETAAISALGSTGCSLTDFACICKNTGFLMDLQPKVAAVCSPADLASALTFASNLCLGVGVTLNVPGAAPATTPAAPATTPAAPATTPVAPVTSAAAAATSSAAPMMSVTTTTMPSAAVVTTLMTTPTPSAITTRGPVSEFSDGQPQAPTNATIIAAPSVTPFAGAATSNTAQGAFLALFAAVGLFVAL